ncbi:hypothetical protein DFJ63DRAFT_221845 [Scheffersomyces coipomensis]|uniref:uncharacterized protein n=1 Tax=Scheffersomyces coipomensis TaxID=1788519 RepID=UPI00315DAA62
MATQLRLRSAKILLFNLGAIGGEVIKNLVLGGLNSITIVDDSTVKEEDFAAQFFLPNDDSIVGQLKLPLVIDRIKELNNRVNLSIDTSPLSSIISNPDFLKQFNLVIATELTKTELIDLNSTTRKLNIPLYATGGHGSSGYILTDLIKHTATSEKDAGNVLRQANTKINRVKTITGVSYNESDNKETITVLDEYCPIADIFNSKELPNQLNKRQMKRLSAAFPLIFALFEIPRLEDPESIVDKDVLKSTALSVCESFGIPSSLVTEEYLEVFSNQAFAEFAPVAAILGGTLAQDVIQYLSQKESPINNVLILDSIKSEMPIYAL